MDDEALLELMAEVAERVAARLASGADWRPSGVRDGQHRADVVADEVAVRALLDAGLGVVSEESGSHQPDRPVVVVVDPVDGSTNAALGLPWWATSLCAVDDRGLRAALVINQATGTCYRAVRGGGATVDGRPVAPSGCRHLGDAVVGLSGWPAWASGGGPQPWRQFRALGAAALDLCAVASGALDAWVDGGSDAHGPWDYLGGLLVCQEAGAPVVDVGGRVLATTDWAQRRTPIAAATPELLRQLENMARPAGKI